MARRKLSDDPMVRAVRKFGFGDMRRSLTFVVSWGMVERSIGHSPTMDEYCEWWNCSRRQAFREQASFRRVTGLDDPAVIVAQARAAGLELDDRDGGLAVVPFMTWAV